MSKNKNCQHEKMMLLIDDDGFPLDNIKCPTCNKPRDEIMLDPFDIDPLCKPSQQPHGGNCTYYCNICQMYVKPDTSNTYDKCPYHQSTYTDSDGVTQLTWEEFNQDGEEW